MNEYCHDCGVSIGEKHLEGCDAVLCSFCGDQLMCCGHYDKGNSIYTGIMHPELHEICIINDLYCKRIGTSWIPCNKNEIDATHDVNKAFIIWHEQFEGEELNE